MLLERCFIVNLDVLKSFNILELRGPTPFFTNFDHKYHFLFLGEKVSSGIWETCPKILGGYVYQNPPKWGLIYIYIYNCMYHIIANSNYFEKYIVNEKMLMNKMCLEFDFTYAMQISSRSVNRLSYFIYIYIYIYIYENYNRNYLEK